MDESRVSARLFLYAPRVALYIAESKEKREKLGELFTRRARYVTLMI